MLGPAGECDVLFILPFMNAGGGERWFTTLADGLTARGHRVWAFVLQQNEGHFRRLFDRYLLCGPLEPMGIDIPQHIAMYINLTKPKAVVFHGSTAGAKAVLAAKHKPRKVVMVKHTVWDDDARLALKAPVRQATTDWVCVSRANAKHLIAWGAEEDKVHTIWNAVDYRLFNEDGPNIRAELNIPPNVPLALHLGRICDAKGSPIVAEGLVQAESRWYCLFVGWGDRVQQVKQITKPIKDRIRFVPATTDVVPYYKAADLLLLPTLAEGGIPYVVMEAAHAGVPAACTDVADMAEFFTDKINYLHIDRTPRSVAMALDWAVEHEHQLEKMGEHAIDNVISVSLTLEQMIDGYRQVLGLLSEGEQNMARRGNTIARPAHH